MLMIKVTHFENHWLSQLEHLCQSLEEEHGGQGELQCNAIRKYIQHFLLRVKKPDSEEIWQLLLTMKDLGRPIWKTQQWPQAWKRSVFIPIPKKGNAKECSNYHTTALISHASKVMLKILQARLQQYMNYELPDVQASFRKGRGTRDQIANIRWIIEKARELQKNTYFCFIDYAKVFDCMDHNKLWKILK